ncbi:Fic family protein [Streptomyces sp. NPDC006309]|uniref:Fic family protein n=1 Tax=Streptomyces sp. NPDC006309 TaxID=3156749 RepID=UPI0033A12C2E
MALRLPDDLDAKLTERARREGRSKQELAIDMGLLVSAIERPRTDVFGAELYPTLHEKAAALLHSAARNRALIDGNKRTAWLAMRVFLRLNGLSAGTPPPPVSVAGPFVEEVAQDAVDVPVIAERLSAWFPVS